MQLFFLCNFWVSFCGLHSPLHASLPPFFTKQQLMRSVVPECRHAGPCVSHAFECQTARNKHVRATTMWKGSNTGNILLSERLSDRSSIIALLRRKCQCWCENIPWGGDASCVRDIPSPCYLPLPFSEGTGQVTSSTQAYTSVAGTVDQFSRHTLTNTRHACVLGPPPCAKGGNGYDGPPPHMAYGNSSAHMVSALPSQWLGCFLISLMPSDAVL